VVTSARWEDADFAVLDKRYIATVSEAASCTIDNARQERPRLRCRPTRNYEKTCHSGYIPVDRVHSPSSARSILGRSARLDIMSRLRKTDIESGPNGAITRRTPVGLAAKL